MNAICVVDIGLSYDNKIEETEKVLQRAIDNASKKVNYLQRPIAILGIEVLRNFVRKVNNFFINRFFYSVRKNIRIIVHKKYIIRQ